MTSIRAQGCSSFQYCKQIVSCVSQADTPGPGQSDVFILPWRHLSRLIYPLDPVGDWRVVSSMPGGGDAA